MRCSGERGGGAQIYKQPIIAISNNEIQNGHHIGKKIFWRRLKKNTRAAFDENRGTIP